MKPFACILLLLLLSVALPQESLDQLRHHWEYDRSGQLDIKQKGFEVRDGIKVFDISYASPVGNRAASVGPNGGIVPAYLIVPPGPGPFPAVIYGHWCMPGSDKKDRTEFLDEALVLAHSGVISLLPDHVSVRPGFVEDTTPLNEQQIDVQVQQDVNLRRGADLLLARKDVDPKRLAYVGHSCDASAGAFLSGLDKRFKAFVMMAGDISFEVDRKTKAFGDYRQKVGPERFDAFTEKYFWQDEGKYISHAAPAAVFLQYATNEPFLNGEIAKQYLEIVSEPKTLKIYEAPHALNAEATRDRIAFWPMSFPSSRRTPQPSALYPSSRNRPGRGSSHVHSDSQAHRFHCVILNDKGCGICIVSASDASISPSRCTLRGDSRGQADGPPWAVTAAPAPGSLSWRISR
jgi:dienelactone hydrolase